MCKLVWPGMGTMLFVCEAPVPVCEHLSGTSSASAFVNTLGHASCSRLSTAVGQREKGKSLGVFSSAGLEREETALAHSWHTPDRQSSVSCCSEEREEQLSLEKYGEHELKEKCVCV